MTVANPGSAEDIIAVEAMRAAEGGSDFYAVESLIRAAIVAQVSAAIDDTRKGYPASELCINAARWAAELGFEVREDCLIEAVEEVAAAPKPRRRSSK